jgi:hypothetical protein
MTVEFQTVAMACWRHCSSNDREVADELLIPELSSIIYIQRILAASLTLPDTVQIRATVSMLFCRERPLSQTPTQADTTLHRLSTSNRVHPRALSILVDSQ